MATFAFGPFSRCSDETFLRRAYLDTTGTLPRLNKCELSWVIREPIVVSDWSKNYWLAMRLLIIGATSGRICC